MVLVDKGNHEVANGVYQFGTGLLAVLPNGQITGNVLFDSNLLK